MSWNIIILITTSVRQKNTWTLKKKEEEEAIFLITTKSAVLCVVIIRSAGEKMKEILIFLHFNRHRWGCHGNDSNHSRQDDQISLDEISDSIHRQQSVSNHGNARQITQRSAHAVPLVAFNGKLGSRDKEAKDANGYSDRSRWVKIKTGRDTERDWLQM